MYYVITQANRLIFNQDYVTGFIIIIIIITLVPMTSETKITQDDMANIHLSINSCPTPFICPIREAVTNIIFTCSLAQRGNNAFEAKKNFT